MSSEELSHALTTLTPLLSTQGTFIFEFIPTSGQTVRGKRSRVGNYDSFYFPKKYLKKMIAEIAKTQGLKLKVKFIDVPGYHVPASETDFSGINMMWSSPTALCIVKKL